MSTKQLAGLTGARVAEASGGRALSSLVRSGANCAIEAMPGAAFTSKWYRNPVRLMSQGERLPS
jgi:hypothetical protein